MGKKTFVVLAILVFGCTFVLATGALASAKKEGFVVGLSNFSLGNSWRVQMVEEAKYAASQHKDRVKKLIVTEADGDISKQISDIEDLISKKVDAILITAISPKA